MRVPCVVTLIGEAAFGHSDLIEHPDDPNATVLTVRSHDRRAAALVPPGNYEVEIYQYTRPDFLFRFVPLDDELEMRCSELLTLELRGNLSPRLAQELARVGPLKPYDFLD